MIATVCTMLKAMIKIAEAAIIEKMALEIESVLDRTTNLPDCELYFLLAKVPDEYPVLSYGDIVIDYIFLVHKVNLRTQK